MGFALARAAHQAGADVTLVAGPVGLASPRGVHRVDVISAQEMFDACQSQASHADIFIACAAVADWRVDAPTPQKIKKDASGAMPSFQFVENPDILASIAQSDRAKNGVLFCVGFAAESNDLLAHATAKRLRKNVPLLVGNLGPATFGKDDNALLLVDAQGSKEIPRQSKRALSRLLVAEIANRITQPRSF